MLFKKTQQQVQGLQKLAFSVVTVNDEHTKESRGVKFKESVAAELRLKLWFESDWYFVIYLSQDGFESDCPERKS